MKIGSLDLTVKTLPFQDSLALIHNYPLLRPFEASDFLLAAFLILQSALESPAHMAQLYQELLQFILSNSLAFDSAFNHQTQVLGKLRSRADELFFSKNPRNQLTELINHSELELAFSKAGLISGNPERVRQFCSFFKLNLSECKEANPQYLLYKSAKQKYVLYKASDQLRPTIDRLQSIVTLSHQSQIQLPPSPQSQSWRPQNTSLAHSLLLLDYRESDARNFKGSQKPVVVKGLGKRTRVNNYWPKWQ